MHAAYVKCWTLFFAWTLPSYFISFCVVFMLHVFHCEYMCSFRQVATLVTTHPSELDVIQDSMKWCYAFHTLMPQSKVQSHRSFSFWDKAQIASGNMLTLFSWKYKFWRCYGMYLFSIIMLSVSFVVSTWTLSVCSFSCSHPSCNWSGWMLSQREREMDKRSYKAVGIGTFCCKYLHPVCVTMHWLWEFMREV